MSNEKILLVYGGPGYAGVHDPTTAYTQANIRTLVNKSNATDFVFLSAFQFNYRNPNANSQIITNDYITNSVTGTDIGSTSAPYIDKIKGWMREGVAAQVGKQDAFNLQRYVSDMVKWAKAFLAEDLSGSKKVWFGLPIYLASCHAAARIYNDVYFTDVINPIEAAMKAAGYGSRIAGYYFAQENIPSGYSKFTEVSPTTHFDNPTVKNMANVKSRLPLGRKFMWIPWYRDKTGDETAARIGRIINLTNIFDIAILQSTYFFHPDEVCDNPTYGVPNVDLVKSCASLNQCRTHSGARVGGGSGPASAQIGPEMEIDHSIWKPDAGAKWDANGYMVRYNLTCERFGTFIRQTPKPVAFYAGGPGDLVQTAITSRISAFFANGSSV